MSAAKRFKRDTPTQKSEQTLREMNDFKQKLNEFDRVITKLEQEFKNAQEIV